MQGDVRLPRFGDRGHQLIVAVTGLQHLDPWKRHFLQDYL